MEEFRTLIADLLSSTLTADKLTKKQFREIEDKFANAYVEIYQTLQKDYYRLDIQETANLKNITITDAEEDAMVEYLDNNFDDEISHWDNIDNAISIIKKD